MEEEEEPFFDLVFFVLLEEEEEGGEGEEPVEAGMPVSYCGKVVVIESRMIFPSI